jgi:hypothetical protein
MVRKTKQKKQKQKNKPRTKRTQKVTHAHVPPPIVENHLFMSSMTFNGNTLTTKTQKDNEPVVEHRYTKKDLAREIPIGNNMVDIYLDGKIPKELKHHNSDNRKPKMFTNVLISPADLGLLPPRMNKTKRRRNHDHDHDHDHDHNHDHNDEMQLLVDDHDDRDAYRIIRRKQLLRNLFNLP